MRNEDKITSKVESTKHQVSVIKFKNIDSEFHKFTN